MLSFNFCEDVVELPPATGRVEFEMNDGRILTGVPSNYYDDMPAAVLPSQSVNLGRRSFLPPQVDYKGSPVRPEGGFEHAPVVYYNGK